MLAPLLLGGCTVVEVTDPEGKVQVTRGVGVVNVMLPEPERNIVTKTMGLGLVSTALGFTIGYASEELALLGPECRLVVWIRNEAEAATLAGLLAGHRDVCGVDPGNSDSDQGRKTP